MVTGTQHASRVLNRHVSASTQNQAFNALLFLHRYVLGIELGDMAATVRAKRGQRLPVLIPTAWMPYSAAWHRTLDSRSSTLDFYGQPRPYHRETGFQPSLQGGSYQAYSICDAFRSAARSSTLARTDPPMLSRSDPRSAAFRLSRSGGVRLHSAGH